MAKKNKTEEQPVTNNTIEVTYCEQRLQELGIPAEQNVISIYNPNVPAYFNVPYFAPKGDDIEILYPTLHGELNTYLDGKKEKPYKRIRFKSPENTSQKYKTPKGAGTRCFLPPGIIKKFKAKEPIETLVIIEGEFKAFKADFHGFDIIGTQGIHNTRDKEHKELLGSITEVVRECKVKNLMLLFDADCLDVEYKEDKDLYYRPNSFYTAVKNFREAAKGINVDIYFAHIRE